MDNDTIQEWSQRRRRGLATSAVLVGMLVYMCWVGVTGHSAITGHSFTLKCLLEDESQWNFSVQDLNSKGHSFLAFHLKIMPWVAVILSLSVFLFNFRKGLKNSFPDARCPACEEIVYPMRTRSLVQVVLHWKEDFNPRSCPNCKARLR